MAELFLETISRTEKLGMISFLLRTETTDLEELSESFL